MSNAYTIALAYITPMDKLNGREETVFAAGKEKLKTARQNSALHWASEVA